MPDQVDWRSMEREASPGHAVGRLLRDQREARALSIEDVAKRLRIRRPYLEAIEQGRFDQLPGAAYIPAFLRAYAAHLELDAEKVLTAYQAVGPRADRAAGRLAGRFPAAREARADRSCRADGAARGRRRLCRVALPAAAGEHRGAEGSAGARSSAGLASGDVAGARARCPAGDSARTRTHADADDRVASAQAGNRGGSGHTAASRGRAGPAAAGRDVGAVDRSGAGGAAARERNVRPAPIPRKPSRAALPNRATSPPSRRCR